MLEVKVKKLTDEAVIPSYSLDGDAGMDLTATSLEANSIDGSFTYGTGLAVEIPAGYVGLIYPRSSIRKYSLQLTNSVGVIDSGYRGEVKVVFKSIIYPATVYKVGDRIAQIMIVPYPKVEFIQTKEISDTVRGSGGYGSTGE